VLIFYLTAVFFKYAGFLTFLISTGHVTGSISVGRPKRLSLSVFSRQSDLTVTNFKLFENIFIELVMFVSLRTLKETLSSNCFSSFLM